MKQPYEIRAARSKTIALGGSVLCHAVIGLVLLLTLQQARAQDLGSFEINNRDTNYAYALGTNSVSLGGNSYVAPFADGGIALGFNTTVSAENSVAIGTNAIANRGAQTYADPFSGQTWTSTGEVSFGSSAGGAQLTNLAPGSASNDAATVGQLEEVTGGLLSQANTYTDNATAGLLGQAQTYAAGIGASTLSSANGYTDQSSANALSTAKTYADGVGSSTLSQASNYADNVGATTLSSAKSYTDNSVALTLTNAKSYADLVGSNTLTTAKSYADSVGAASDAYADMVGANTLSAANSYTDNATAATLVSADKYADGVGAATLQSANSYADSVGATTLTAAKSYTDASSAATLNSAMGYADSVGANTLASANRYTDAMGASVLNTANTYTDSRTQFFAANSALAPAQATGLETLSLGGGSLASGNNAVVLGSNAQATADNTFAGGYGATVIATGGVALGAGANVSAANSAAIGMGSLAQRGAQSNYIDPLSGHTTNSAGEVSVGSVGAERQITNVAAGSAATDAANVGQVASAQTTAIDISEGYTNSTANSLVSYFNSFGYNTSVNNGPGSVALGNGASATGQNATAIGPNSTATASNSVALGAGARANRGAQTDYRDPISGRTANSVGEVSLGSPGAERQITNVAPGTAPTDAANVGQVQAAIADANGYTNAMFGKAAQQTWSVAAVSQALANLPQAPEPGQSMIGMGMGFSHGEVGMAVGGSYYMPDNSVIFKASASYGARAGMSAGMGAGFVLN